MPARKDTKEGQFAYFLDVLIGNASTGDAAADFVIKDGFAKGGKRPDLSAIHSKVEGVRKLRKELEANRGRPVLAQYGDGSEGVFPVRWGTVAKKGDVLLVESRSVSLDLGAYKGGALNINTDGFHRGYDMALYARMYELNSNLPFIFYSGHLFGKKAEGTIKVLEEKHCGSVPDDR